MNSDERMKEHFNLKNALFKVYTDLYNNSSGFPVKDNYHSPFKDYIESKYTNLDFKFQNIIICSHKKLDGINAKETARKWRESL